MHKDFKKTLSYIGEVKEEVVKPALMNLDEGYYKLTDGFLLGTTNNN